MKTMLRLALLFFAQALFAGNATQKIHYTPASDAEIEAILAEGRASGDIVDCIGADTPSGCR